MHQAGLLLTTECNERSNSGKSMCNLLHFDHLLKFCVQHMLTCVPVQLHQVTASPAGTVHVLPVVGVGKVLMCWWCWWECLLELQVAHKDA
jgi:hypothetical protein